MLAEAEAYVNRFLDHWRGLREARQIPRKSALNPIEIKDDLPHLSIHERKDRETFIYRLHGTGIAAHSPVDRTGENVIANTPEIWREAVAMLLNAILDQPCVIREEHTFLDPVLGVRAREGLHLPLADDDDDPRFVLSYYPPTGPRDHLPLYAMREPDSIRQSIAMVDLKFIDIGAGIPEYAAAATAKVNGIARFVGDRVPK